MALILTLFIILFSFILHIKLKTPWCQSSTIFLDPITLLYFSVVPQTDKKMKLQDVGFPL